MIWIVLILLGCVLAGADWTEESQNDENNWWDAP